MEPKLLLISAISPTPQNSGGATRIQHTLKEVSKYCQTDLITFDESEIKIQPKKISLFFKKGIPYWFTPWYSQKLISQVQKLINDNHYDIIQIEFSQLLYLIKYLPKNIKKVFTAHDISYISFYRRILEDNPSLIKKVIRFFLFLQIYFYEKKYLPKFDTIITVSQKDKKTLQHQLPNKKIICLSNGIDEINLIKKKISSILKLGYIGSFKHTPNINALNYFFNKISPTLEKERILYQFYLAGDNGIDFVKDTFPKIINLGHVKETADFYKKIDCLVVPLLSGSGSRIKILEALSFGIPVISSSIGAEGIKIKTPYLQITDNPKDYSKLLLKLPKNDFKNLKNELTPFLWTNIFKNYLKKI